MSDNVSWLLVTFDWFVLGYFVLLNSSYLLLIGIAATGTIRRFNRANTGGLTDIFANPLTPPVSVIVPAYNEESCIVESTRAGLGLRYPKFEIIVVDDGSSDETFERLRAEFDLVEVAPTFDRSVETIGQVQSVHVPRSDIALVVVRKVNAGRRADALNVGINAATHPLVCCIDADSILEVDALLHVVKPFVDDPDRVIATGGSIRAVNGSNVYRGEVTTTRQPSSWLARIQIIEYLRAFLLGRVGWSKLGALLIISGAFGLYRRDLLVEIGGFDPDSLGEDADVLIGLHRLMRDRKQDYQAVFVPDPVCWTEVPSTRTVLGRQRVRWSHGLAQVLWKYRAMMCNPRYGRIGLVALPYYLIFELLGPVVEVLGLVAVVAGFAFGLVSVEFTLLFATVAILYGVGLSIAALLVEEVSFHKYKRWQDIGIGVLATVAENLGYRQLHAWWRLKGLAHALLGKELAWGEMTRAGFEAEEPAPTPSTRSTPPSPSPSPSRTS